MIDTFGHPLTSVSNGNLHFYCLANNEKAESEDVTSPVGHRYFRSHPLTSVSIGNWHFYRLASESNTKRERAVAPTNVED